MAGPTGVVLAAPKTPPGAVAFQAALVVVVGLVGGWSVEGEARLELAQLIAGALGELHAAGLAAVDIDDQDVTAVRWLALPVACDPLLEAVDLHGAHDFRHTYATWLEDAGIPARVIDELMGHEATGRSRQHQGSAMGAHYRHTTPEMALRIIDSIDGRLTIVLGVAELTVERHLNPSTLRVF